MRQPRIISIAEMRQRRGSPWLIWRTVAQQSLVLLAADYAAFKSFMALWWALAVAAGGEWAGRAVVPGNVLYIVGEGSGGIPARIRAWEQHHGVTVERMYFLPAPVQFLDGDDVAALAEEIAAREAEHGAFALIVVDTVARAMVGGDENKQQDMGRFVAACDALKTRFGCTVVAVHHYNKSGTTRGSNTLPAACDTIYTMKRDGESVTLTCEKMKDAAEPASLEFKRTVVTFDPAQDDQYAPLDDDDDRTSLVLEAVGVTDAMPAMTKDERQRELARILLDCLDEGNGVLNKDWEAFCTAHAMNAKGKKHMGRNDFYAAKKALLASGRVGGDGKKRNCRYHVTVVTAA